MTDNPKVSEEFMTEVQYLFSGVDHVVHNANAMKEAKAGYMVAVTIPDSRDGTHRIVAMLSDPAHPEVVEGMVTKFFKTSSYGVFPVSAEAKDG